MKANLDLVTCPVCRQTTHYWSSILLTAGYGSEYDTEQISVKMCGGCFDSIVNEIRKKVSFDDMSVEFVL